MEIKNGGYSCFHAFVQFIYMFIYLIYHYTIHVIAVIDLNDAKYIEYWLTKLSFLHLLTVASKKLPFHCITVSNMLRE